MNTSSDSQKTFMQKFLDVVEAVGNKVPHPVVIFLILIGIVIGLSHVLHLTGAKVTYDVLRPVETAPEYTTSVPPVWAPEADVYDAPLLIDSSTVDDPTAKYEIVTNERHAQSLLTRDGIRFMYSSLIPSFMGFTAVGLIIVAMLGVGVAEEAGLINALIRKLVIVAPRGALTYILVFVGILSSIAADAGYLVLIPLAGVAFLSVGRHPLAGLAAGFAAVAAAFTVNILIKPLDAILTEFTNDAIRSTNPELEIGLAANLWFSIASVVLLTIVIAQITERVIEPRLGPYKPQAAAPGDAATPAAGTGAAAAGKPGGGASSGTDGGQLSPAEARGLRFAWLGLAGVLLVFALLTLPANAPLRNPETGALIGDSPFMNGLIAFITIVFFVMGLAYGIGAGTMKSSTDVIKAMEKAVSGLGGLIFLLLVISQFVAYFNYSNMATLLAVTLSNALSSADIQPLWLLLGFIGVVALLDLLITGAIAKWAIFAPVFVPLLVNLKVDPEAVLAAYRVGDSPINAITPLNAYFALVVTFTQKYDRNAGVGTLVALMLPYVVILLVLWTILFAAWFLFGLPWGV